MDNVQNGRNRYFFADKIIWAWMKPIESSGLTGMQLITSRNEMIEKEFVSKKILHT